MPKPTYVEAFEHFKSNNEDALKAYVAFGLYIEAECKWAELQPTWPTPAKYRDWYDVAIPHTVAAHNDNAIDVLQDFANNIVAQQKAAFLTAAMAQYQQAAAQSKKSFLDGVIEAATGALAWTLFLIVISIIINRAGIDLLEIYGKVAGVKTEHAAPPPAPAPAH